MNYYIKILNSTEAKKLHKEGKTEIYKYFDDDTEALIESEHDLNDAIDLGINLGIEVKLFNQTR